MPECNTSDDGNRPSAPPDPPEEPDGLPVSMTLEDIIELTGEMEHLNELVLLRLENEGGFTTTEAYFATVQPILDLLEVCIRVRCHAGMSKKEMKVVIRDLIDGEIRALRSCSEEARDPGTHIANPVRNHDPRVDAEHREDEDEIEDRTEHAAKVPERGDQDHLE
jgi:hypothetical protein